MLTKYRQILKKKPSNLKNLFDCAFDYPCAILNAVADILTGKHTSLFNGVSPISSNTQAYEIYANQYTERKNMSTNYPKLSDYFPAIRTEELIRKEIAKDNNLSRIFNMWTDSQRKEFLDICTGAKGVKMLYDSYFKEILNPETKPERLSALLTTVLGQKVRVKKQLPNDNSRIGDELSLVITDIVVELEDGTIANVEVQKVGYKFLGERASCYVADLLLRQYKRIKELAKEKDIPFTYRDVPPVYTIVFMESSPSVFKDYPDVLMHTFNSRSDSGIELNMLQNVVFIPIDIFVDKLHNEGINNEFEGWLTFLGCDEPEYIIRLIDKYPFFKSMYQDLYDMCVNVERVMNMFSKELQELDHNTVIYMIDELQDKVDSLKDEANDLTVKNTTLAAENSTLSAENSTLSAENSTLSAENSTLSAENSTLSAENSSLSAENAKLRKLLAENGIQV